MYQDKKNSIFASQKLRSKTPETARKKHLAVPQNQVQNIRPCLFWKKGKPKKLSARRMAPSKQGLEDHKSIYIMSIQSIPFAPYPHSQAHSGTAKETW